jgi:hypothetical protein
MHNKCLKCNKKMKVIKNDFNNRKYCKKCYFNNKLEFQYKWMLEDFKHLHQLY